MPLRTISLALIANSDPDPTAAVHYALDLAGRARAHLLARKRPPLGHSDAGVSHAWSRVANAGDHRGGKRRGPRASRANGADDPNRGGKVGRDRLRRGSLRRLRPSSASSDADGARQRCLHNAGARHPPNRNSAKFSSTCYSAPALPCCSFPRIGTSPAPSEKRSSPGMAAPLPPARCETRCHCSPPQKWWRSRRFWARRTSPRRRPARISPDSAGEACRHDIGTHQDLFVAQTFYCLSTPPAILPTA
jgi:hypothetical protein